MTTGRRISVESLAAAIASPEQYDPSFHALRAEALAMARTGDVIRHGMDETGPYMWISITTPAGAERVRMCAIARALLPDGTRLLLQDISDGQAT